MLQERAMWELLTLLFLEPAGAAPQGLVGQVRCRAIADSGGQRRSMLLLAACPFRSALTPCLPPPHTNQCRTWLAGCA